MTVSSLDDLDEIVRESHVAIGVIATPAGAAQDVCDRLVAAGVGSILNFAPAVLAVPAHVDVRKVDLSIELQILAYHEQRKANGLGCAEGPDDVIGGGRPMSILIVGASHRTASVELLEQLALDTAGAAKLRAAVLDSDHACEALVLATCNRIEIYAEVDRFHGSVEDLTALLADYAQSTMEDVLGSLYVHYDEAAVAHLFEVADGSGLHGGRREPDPRPGQGGAPAGAGRLVGGSNAQLLVPTGPAGRQAGTLRDRHRPCGRSHWSRWRSPRRLVCSALSRGCRCASSAQARWPPSLPPQFGAPRSAEIVVCSRTVANAERLAAASGGGRHRSTA